MVKSELIAKISAHVHQQLSLKDVEMSVNTILERMSKSLSEGQRIEIRGFGSFELHYRPPRQAHNPKTGEKVHTRGKYSPYFKPGKELRERVNESRSRVPIKHLSDKDADFDDEDED